MAKDSEKVRVKRWRERIGQSEKSYTKWAETYKVAKCKRYYKGHQRIASQRLDKNGDERVIVNLIRPTVAVAIPSLYFYHPYVRINASPAVEDTPGQTLEERVQLLQDTANTIIHERETAFRRETLGAFRDAFWAYGVVEVGYSADFADNPSFKRPALVEDEKVKDEMGGGGLKAEPPNGPEDVQDAGDISPEGGSGFEGLEKFVQKETFYVRRIPPETFRCSVSGKPSLEHNDWLGYYEWLYVEDVKEATAYRRTSGLKASGKLDPVYDSAASAATITESTTVDKEKTDERELDRSGMVKLWKIWDVRTKKRYVLAEGHDSFLLEADYETFPLFVLRFEEDPDEFYPIPPIFSMLGPQDEYNDSREMLRGLRKTVYPRHLVRKNTIEDDELRKLEDGGPNVYAQVDGDLAGVMMPVQQPMVDSAVVRTLAVSKDDLAQVSLTSGESRGQAESDTATQASIIDRRSQIRESFGRLYVAEWLGDIVRALLSLAIDKMSLSMWVFKNLDPFSPAAQDEAAKITEQYRQITMDDLSDANRLLRWDVKVDIESMSPLTEETARQELGQLVQMIGNPAIATLLSRAPALAKRFLETFGVRNANEQDEIGAALGAVSALSLIAPGSLPAPPAPQGPPGPGASFSAAPGGPGGPTPDQMQPPPTPQGQVPPAPPQTEVAPQSMPAM